MFLSSLCWELNFSFQIINVHPIPKQRILWPSYIFPLISHIPWRVCHDLILTLLPNEPDISLSYISFLGLSCSIISFQPNKQTNKHPHLITSLKPILKAHKINLCKQTFERSLSENKRTRSWNSKDWFWCCLVFWFAKLSKHGTPTGLMIILE